MNRRRPIPKFRSEAEVLVDWFAVRKTTALVGLALFKAKGGVVPFNALVGSVCETIDSLRAHVCYLRAAMDTGSIERHTGYGYAMTPIGLADCMAALIDAQERGILIPSVNAPLPTVAVSVSPQPIRGAQC
jgi:hypothetical protein